MLGKWSTRVGALVMFALLGSILTPGCGALGLGACEASGGGGAGGDGEIPAAGCTPSRSCSDMFEACHDKGKPCTRIYEGSMTLCGVCRRDCQAKKPYTTSECYKCGFDDP